MNLIDRAISAVSPSLALQRARARSAHHALMRYDAATTGRRGRSARATATDADGAAARRSQIAYVSRDLVRNAPFAQRAKSVIIGNTVGDGIVPSINASDRVKRRGTELLKQHFDTTAIDADGRQNLYGLQRLAMASVVESGEVLIRRRRRFVSDGLPLPFQVQVLEPDFLDDTKDGPTGDGRYVSEGIEYDQIGRRLAYHLYDEHPGSDRHVYMKSYRSRRVPASEILHIYRQDRPGQMRGVSWFAPVTLTIQDFADYMDAQVMRQKIAACFAAFVYSSEPDAEIEDNTGSTLQPGAIQTLGPGREIQFSSPPKVDGFDEFTRVVLRSVAAGMGVTYESLAGDLENVNYSSARMGRMEMDRNVSAWQWLMLIPQMMDPIARWFMEAWRAQEAGVPQAAEIAWTPPRRVIVDPSKEIGAMVTEIRAGLRSRQDAIRTLGYDPEVVAREIAEDNKQADELGLVLDTDPRQQVRAEPGDAPAEPGNAPAD